MSQGVVVDRSGKRVGVRGFGIGEGYDSRHPQAADGKPHLVCWVEIDRKTLQSAAGFELRTRPYEHVRFSHVALQPVEGGR